MHICIFCKKPVKERDKFVAYGEATGTWMKDYPNHEPYLDDIEPVHGGWDLAHLDCFFKGD